MSTDRLSAADLSMIWPEDFGWPQDIGAIAVFDGSILVDANGRFRSEEVRDQIGRRLSPLARFRQCLYMPRRGLGWPLWVDANSVDLARHVGVFPLEAADEAEFLSACERLRRRPLDRSRPLWELWVPPRPATGTGGAVHEAAPCRGGRGGRSGCLRRIPRFHPGRAPPSALPWTPAPIPSNSELLRDNLSRRAQAARTFLSRLAHPGDTVREIRRDWPVVREAFGEGRAPLASLNRRVGSDRRPALIRSRLDVTKDIAHAQGGTVNDVLLTAVAGGLRGLLQSRGERVEGLVLRAMVPVSLHHEQPGQARGNLDRVMMVPLPIGEPDDLRRLRWIAGETARRAPRERTSAAHRPSVPRSHR